MARNKTVHLEDIKIVYESRSKYIINKSQYINKKYNKLYLKDIVCDTRGYVYGVCDCDCGETNIVTAIRALLDYKTKSCSSCARATGSGFNSKYASDEYIGKIYGNLKVIKYYYGRDDNGQGVFWRTKCLLCNNEKDFKASSLVNGTTISCGCVLNNRNNKYSDDSWLGKDIYGTKVLKILDKEYDGQMWLCKCKYCGADFKALARKIVSRHTNSCGCVNESIGIIEISKYLDSKNIQYIKEWSNQKLLSQYGNRLRYDFAIIKDNKLYALIEYDGNQHKDPWAGFGSYDQRLNNFNDIVDSDNRKNQFAKINNIPLLRINYSRKSEEIINELDSFINKLKL